MKAYLNPCLVSAMFFAGCSAGSGAGALDSAVTLAPTDSRATDTGHPVDSAVDSVVTSTSADSSPGDSVTYDDVVVSDTGFAMDAYVDSTVRDAPTADTSGYAPDAYDATKVDSGVDAAKTDSAATDTADASPFTLAWQDDFNTLDSSRWQLQTFTYAGNLATFSTQNASVSNGILTLSLTKAPSGSATPYLGVEMRSSTTITYGKVSASMRFATGSGVVSGLVLFYTPYPNCDWNEIDIEHLGDSSLTSQLNAMVYTGTINPNCTTSVTPTQDPLVVSLGFNAETAFHQYDIEWTPAGVKYFGDGVLLRTWTANIALLKDPMTVLLTIWASSSASWAGAITGTSVPTTAQVDWIKVYTWNG